ncbi:MAG: ribosome silencing factor [Clostridia bacterium]|nr:ribosome silencing factor [Clostridia bacterium]
MTSKELAAKVCGLLDEKHISNIVTIDVADKTSITNYYVVGTARNATVAKTAAEYVEDKMEKDPEDPTYIYRREGEREGRWIVLDYGLVVVHIFHTDLRAFYEFEKLWADPDGSNILHFSKE